MDGGAGGGAGRFIRLVSYRQDLKKEMGFHRLFGGSAVLAPGGGGYCLLFYLYQSRTGTVVFIGGGTAGLCNLPQYRRGISDGTGTVLSSIFSLLREKGAKIYEFFKKALYFFEKMVYNENVSLQRKEGLA